MVLTVIPMAVMLRRQRTSWQPITFVSVGTLIVLLVSVRMLLLYAVKLVTVWLWGKWKWEILS